MGPLCNLFPTVYEVVSNKESFAKDFMFGLGIKSLGIWILG